MKLLFVIQGLRSGGAERVMSVLCNEMAACENIEVALALTERADQIAYQIDPRVQIIDLTPQAGSLIKKRINGIKDLRTLYLRYKPDAVISFITRTNISAIAASFFTGIPVIISERNNPVVDPPTKLSRFIRNRVYPMASGYVFQTRFAQEYFSKPIRKKSIVIANPVSSSVCEYCNNSDRQRRVIAVCRLEPQKNIKLLIDAFDRAVDTHLEYHLDIFGTGTLEEELRTYIKSKGHPDRISLKGFTAEAIREMSESEIFVLSSNYEGMPNALIEAMSVGCACIATDAPAYGARDVIRNNENGILIPVNDCEALTVALNRLMSDKGLVHKLSNHAKEIYKDYAVAYVMKQWMDYIRKVIAENE